MSTIKIDNRMIVVAGLLLVLTMIAKPVWGGREQWQFGQGQDDGIYMVTAKSLAAGEGYRHPNLPGHPYATKYPPMFPLYLSMAWRLTPDFPRTLVTASILQDCLLPVCLALLFLVLRRMGLSARRALVAAAMMFVSFPFVFLAVTLYSELLFLCFLLAAIWTCERAVERDSGWMALLAGLFAGLAYLTRNAALPLLAAVPIFFLLRKRSRLSLFFLALAAPAAVGWHAWGAMHAAVRVPYLHEYVRVIRATGFGPHVMDQVSTLSGAVAETFFPGVLEYLHGIPLHHLVLAAAIVGGVRIGRRRQWPLYLIFTGLYLIMITLWWFQGMGRLIIPVWPVLLAGILEEGGHFAGLCARSIERPRFKVFPRWAMIGLALYIVIRNDEATWRRTALIYATEREGRARDRLAYEWIAGHAGSDEMVLAWKEGASYLYTGISSSHDLFVEALPQTDEGIGTRQRPEVPGGQFKSAVLLLLASDLGADNPLDTLRARVESLPGSRLEFSAPGALVYRLPMP
jgi:Dolichyl-phosphate-mannose-protein mannosyltransferase